jgi:hypothetical protein
MTELLKSLGYEILDGHNLIGYVKHHILREAIYDFFDNKKTKADDTLVFYYSGHGIPTTERDLCLAPSEIDPAEDPHRRGFSSHELTRLMQKSVSLRVVTFLDCCFSGVATLGKEPKGNENDAARLGKAAMDSILPQGQGKYILSASQATQEAYELKQQNHSIFTYFLLKGLRENEKSVDRDGNVTPYSLGVYIYKAILNLPSKRRPEQTPTIKADASGDVILASYPDLAKQTNASARAVTSPITQPSQSKSEFRKEREKQQQSLFRNSKILLPIIATIIIGIVIALSVSGFFHTQPLDKLPNHHPISNGQDVKTSLNTPVDIKLTAKDLDLNDSLHAIIVSKPLYGTLGEINQDTGNIIYTPKKGFSGTDQFMFKVNDGKVDSNAGTISITVMKS